MDIKKEKRGAKKKELRESIKIYNQEIKKLQTKRDETYQELKALTRP